MELNEAKHHILELTKKQEYVALKVYLNAEIDRLHHRLEEVREPYEIGKIQGCIKTLRQMLQLEKEVINL